MHLCTHLYPNLHIYLSIYLYIYVKSYMFPLIPPIPIQNHDIHSSFLPFHNFNSHLNNETTWLSSTLIYSIIDQSPVCNQS